MTVTTEKRPEPHTPDTLREAVRTWHPGRRPVVQRLPRVPGKPRTRVIGLRLTDEEYDAVQRIVRRGRENGGVDTLGGVLSAVVNHALRHFEPECFEPADWADDDDQSAEL